MKDKTISSSFGMPGRVNHDSTNFYDSKMYKSFEKKSKSIDIIIKNSTKTNMLFNHSSECMHEIEDNSIHLVVTSPPYNVKKEYDRDLSLDEYREFLLRVWKEVYRVLVPGGRICINVANVGRKPYIPLHTYIIFDMLSIGFLMRGEIIWDKGSSAGVSTAWGSWQSAANPVLRDVHEYILVFSKQDFSRKKQNRENI